MQHIIGHSELRCIVADPPWLPTMAAINGPASGLGAPKASPQRHYPTMSVEDIEGMRVESATKAHLWLWTLSQHMDWGWRVARAWGFEPIQTITWCKPGMGAGRFQCNTEHVILCRKGTRHGNPFGMTGGTWFNWPRGRHSEKPAAFFDMVERVSPGPRLEMFARTTRLGWQSWGNEVPCTPNTPVDQREASGPTGSSR